MDAMSEQEARTMRTLTEDDLYWIERAARHTTAALDSFDHIPSDRWSRDVFAQINRLQDAERRLCAIRDRAARRLGITQEEIAEWDSP
jgi:hypothetical protein